MKHTLQRFLRAALAALCVSLLAATVGFAAEAAKDFNIPAAAAATMLKQFTTQSGGQLLYSTEDLAGVKLAPVQGHLTPREALERMVDGTSLRVSADKQNGALTLTRVSDPNAPRVAQKEAATQKDQSKVEDGKLVLDKFEVMGSRVLNMDKPRSRDDAQPYVIFGREMITNSGATNLEDFFRLRLPQNASTETFAMGQGTFGAASSINLRGLGTNQTLILVDGRRLGNMSYSGAVEQPDINGIPLSAIERIEILPTTASGIYGGGATGGVINVILRRDYAGVEVKATYDNSFKTDSANKRLDLSAGTTLEGGKTNLLLAASWSTANTLLMGDRAELYARGIGRVLAADPNYFINRSSPPLGGTTNIRSSNGSNLVLKAGNVPLNSKVTFVPYGYTGVASDGGAALVANAGKYNLDQPNSAQPGGKQYALLGAPERRSVILTARRQFTPWLQLFAEYYYEKNITSFPSLGYNGFFSSIPVSSPANPFTTPVTVNANLAVQDFDQKTFSTRDRLSGGAIFKLPADWKGTVDYSYDKFTNQHNFSGSSAEGALEALVNSGAVNLFRDPNVFRPNLASAVAIDPSNGKQSTSSYTAAARASGPLPWGWAAGRPTVSMLAEHRGEKIPAVSFTTVQGYPTVIAERSQSTDSAYVEISIPLVSAAMQVPVVQELSLQLAGRADRYDITGSNVADDVSTSSSATRKFSSRNPTVGFHWKLNPSLALRGSYGTGFLPPGVTQLTPVVFPVPGFIVGDGTDPKRGNTALPAMIDVAFTGNPNLRPELSETWSAGVIFTPKALDGFRLSLDWTRINKRDNIAQLPFGTWFIYEDAIPGVVTRAPKAPGDPYSVGVVTQVSSAPLNYARNQVETLDLQVDYTRDLGAAGRLDFWALATRNLHFKTQITPDAPFVENVGVSYESISSSLGAIVGTYPGKFRASGGVNWTRGRWTAGWSMSYYSSTMLDRAWNNAAIIAIQGNGGRVDSLLTHDVFASYRFPASVSTGGLARWLANVEVRAGVRNVFDTPPPFNAQTNQRMYYSAVGDPRGASYNISVKKSF